MDINVEKIAPMFLEAGAFGVLAMAFIVQMILHIRSDRRAAQYAAALKEVSFDREQLIRVVEKCTEVMTRMSEQSANSANQLQQLTRRVERNNA